MRQMVVGLLIAGVFLVGLLIYLGVRRMVKGAPEKKKDPWLR